MALKRREPEVVPISSSNATPARTIITGGQTKRRIKRLDPQAEGQPKYITKEQLENQLVILTLKSFEPAYNGSYGPTERVFVDAIVVEDGAKHEDIIFHSGLAKQVGEYLEPGEFGLGRIVSGPNKKGNGRWWGFDWSTDDSELDAADALLETSEIPY